MSENTIATIDRTELLEKVLIRGDLAELDADQRLEYYQNVCVSLGLNPLTKPFLYITLNGKLVLYASKDATEQLAAKHQVSIVLGEGTLVQGLFSIRATASMPSGRHVDATGVVSFPASLRGDSAANAMMKAETKAARRATLRLIGLGWLDETETETIDGAVQVEVDTGTGEIQRASPHRVMTSDDAYNQFRSTVKKRWPGISLAQLKRALDVDDISQILVTHSDYDAAVEAIADHIATRAQAEADARAVEPEDMPGRLGALL
jgi:hypothetical protein